jgi:hypothetical protein
MLIGLVIYFTYGRRRSKLALTSSASTPGAADNSPSET